MAWKVAVDAEIIPNSNTNRRRARGQLILPPAIEAVDERVLRVRTHDLIPARKSTARLVAKDFKPLPPLPGNTQPNPNFLATPYTNSRRPAAPHRISRASTINIRSSNVSGRLSTMAEEVVFRDVMKAVYDYAATADDELTMKEDQLLYLLGNLDDDWAKVQVHGALDALSEAEPAAGLVPSAYIEPAPSLYRAVALYDYEPNGEGEILMKENEKLSVYLKEDEWILVKIDRKGTLSQPAIGYVPANYIEQGEGDGEASAQEEPVPQVVISIPPTPGTPTAQAENAERAAAAAAKLRGDPVDIWNISKIDIRGEKKKGTLGVGNGSIFFASEADKAPIQKWQVSMVTSVYVNADKNKHVSMEINTAYGEISLKFGAGSRDEANAIVEKVDRSKRLAVGRSSPPPKSPEPAANTSEVVIKSPTPSAPDGGLSLPSPAHLRMSPSPSGRSKGVPWDTAPPAEFPRAVQTDEGSVDHTAAAAAPSPSAGIVVAIALYDFEADGDDELTVKEGEKLTVLDKEESEEWWKCRNSRGKQGVVPASYLEARRQVGALTSFRLTQYIPRLQIESAEEAEDSAAAEAAAEAARAEAAQKEQERAAAAAAKAKRLADESRRKREQEAREAQEQQEREKAEAREAEAQRQREERDRAKEARRREAEAQAQTSSKFSTNGTPKSSYNRGRSKDLSGRPILEKPRPTNTRIWHDRSGQFKVEAQFLGIHKNKIRLHKANGIIIEVPEEMISATDMEFIRKLNQNPTSPTSSSGAPATSLPTAGATPSFLTSQLTGFNPSFNQAPQPPLTPLSPPPTPPVQPAAAPQPVATPAAQTPAAQLTAAPYLGLSRSGSSRSRSSAPSETSSATDSASNEKGWKAKNPFLASLGFGTQAQKRQEREEVEARAAEAQRHPANYTEEGEGDGEAPAQEVATQPNPNFFTVPYATPKSPATNLAPCLTTGSGKWVKFVTVVPGQHARFRIRADMPPIYGGFSDVWRCDARFSDGRVIAAAMKKFRAVRIARDADASTVINKLLKRLTKELDIWMALQHPRISPLLGFALEDDLCIISPWYTNGNVTDYIDRHPEADRIKLVSDVVSGLAYLHTRVPLVVHGDMKADNVLIDDAGNAVLIDFGLSAIVEDDPTRATSLATISSLQDAGNVRWMAPELLMEEGCTRSPSTDVYSFGCVALQIHTGEIPFKDVPTFQIVHVLIKGQKPLAKREDTQLSSPSLDWFYDLLVSCWDENPTARPSMVDVESKLRMEVRSGGVCSA